MRKFKFIIFLFISWLLIFRPIINLNSQISFVQNFSQIEDSIANFDTLIVSDVDSIRLEKISAVRDFMHKSVKSQGYKVENIKLEPEAIVDMCERNNFSIPFTLAVAKLESCFGQTPRAKRTNSIFSVGSYDNGKDVYMFSTQNESIEHFINLIKKDYLINGKKEISDILAQNGFVNKNGDRYATNQKYESQIKIIMKKISKTYPILARD